MKIIITGGAGFIGCNAAARSLKRGDEVVLVDNLSRAGAAKNLEWLQSQGAPEFRCVDVRDAGGIDGVFRDHADAEHVLHLAGQVAVTSSVDDPRADFEVNALGTLNVLEAIRLRAPQAAVLYASTNKVYGGLEHLHIVDDGDSYRYGATPHGVSEDEPLDFYSPYGCSKGSADQYVRDYHRIYGLRTIVFRQSCIYGYRQFGVEDQGWVAWFAIAAQQGRPISVFGDGKQVRDVLFIDDLLDAFDAALTRIDTTAGRIYNIGGGTGNVISLRQLLAYLTARKGCPLDVSYDDWRPGDQRVFVSDIRRSASELGWAPNTPWQRGVELLSDWVADHRTLFP
jgi:CDP-paratose 2-epimerase